MGSFTAAGVFEDGGDEDDEDAWGEVQAGGGPVDVGRSRPGPAGSIHRGAGFGLERRVQWSGSDTVRTIRVIFQGGDLKLLEAADLPENTPLTLALLEGDDLPVEGLVRAAQAGGAFDFLGDPREDIYSESDGEAV